MKKRIALFPGSFDPIHSGHIHIIKKAIDLFDELILCVSINVDKLYDLSLLERKSKVEKVIKKLKLKNVKVISWPSYIVDAAKLYKAKYLITSVRNMDDFQQSLHNASINKKLDKKLETIVFFSDVAYQSISSSDIKKTLKKHNKFFKSNKN
ncbi:pantetheine-phosphate adenylyltransferase [Mycoplasmoides alvi]|uniref:pantetheine-phosphate adenylyltransferase n=1 Tax=Mycoplasmoides alvi TaxID=78580 RepID=UPI00051BEC6E|nr:pantetheine-phosphate adenylyltransferase [Mycoplasmoides alvi]